MNIKLETYLQQCDDWLDDKGIEREINKLRKRTYAICISMERGTITQEEADKRYKPIALKIHGLSDIQTKRNIEKCKLFDAFIANAPKFQIVSDCK